MENKLYIDCPKFTGRNVPITEIAKAKELRRDGGQIVHCPVFIIMGFFSSLPVIKWTNCPLKQKRQRGNAMILFAVFQYFVTNSSISQ